MAVLVTDALIEIIILKIIALNVAPKTDKASETGPLVTEQHLAEVRGYIDTGESEGAKVVKNSGTSNQDVQGYEGGYFLGGTLLDNSRPA